MGRLSVCCLTAERPAMVASLMSLFRPVADELIVAMDSRVGADGFGPLLDVADLVVRFEYVEPPERTRPWLVGLCKSEHVLMIDGDEVPSTALIAALPDLLADHSVQQVRIARRWCFPDERSWLAERPWWPDFQRRLFRPGPHLGFDVRFHGGVQPSSPSRCVEESIYHLAHVARPLSVRRRRSREYEQARPGIAAVGGGSMNDILYWPERFATRRPVPTPDEDMHVLRSVIDAPDPTSRSTTDVPIMSAEAIGAHLPPDPLEAQGYRADMSIVEEDLRTDPGTYTHVLVNVANTGAAPLPCRDAAGIGLRVAARLVARRSGIAHPDWAMTSLPCDIPAGEARLVDAFVQAPTSTGTFDLEIALVNQRGRWFEGIVRSRFDVTTRWGRFGS